MGAIGTGPWQNDSALDWLYRTRVQREIERVFQQALKPMTEKTFHVFPKRAASAHQQFFTLSCGCQHEALAAVDLLLAVPALHGAEFVANKSCVVAATRTRTLIEAAKLVLFQLQNDLGFVQTWNEPKKYLAVLRKTERRVMAVLRVRGRERAAVLGRHVKRVKRMSKAARDKQLKPALPRKLLASSDCEAARTVLRQPTSSPSRHQAPAWPKR